MIFLKDAVVHSVCGVRCHFYNYAVSLVFREDTFVGGVVIYYGPSTPKFPVCSQSCVIIICSVLLYAEVRRSA